MTNETKIRKLTWEYFFKQKKEELSDLWERAFPLIVTGTLIFAAFFQIGWAIDESTGLPYSKTLGIIGFCIVGFWFFILLIYLIKVFCEWISSNWEEANKKARRKIK